MRPLVFLLIALALLCSFLEGDKSRAQRDRVIIDGPDGRAVVPAGYPIVCRPEPPTIEVNPRKAPIQIV